MARAVITDETRQAIRDMVAGGASQREVSRSLGVSVGVVSKNASDLVSASERSRTEKATAIRARWDTAARVELLNKGFDAMEALTDMLTTPSRGREWATAVGILIDKRRLEDGESDGSAPSTLIQIQAIDYRHATAHLAPSDEGGPVGYLPAPGEGQSAGDGETLG